MKNILILTDFSDKCSNAQEYVMQLFSGITCEFHLLSIQKFWEFTMDDFMVAQPEDDVVTALLGDNASLLQKEIKQLKNKYAQEPYTFHPIVDYDVFLKAVKDAVNNYNVDLIVVGSNGESNIIERLFSSHTMRIIRNTSCPVLAVPEGFKFIPPATVHYMMDYKDTFQERGNQILLELLKHFDGQLLVSRLNISHPLKPADLKQEQQLMENYFGQEAVSYKIHHSGVESQIMQEVMNNDNTYLQVLMAHKETFLERIFSDSQKSHFINATSKPILILHGNP